MVTFNEPAFQEDRIDAEMAGGVYSEAPRKSVMPGENKSMSGFSFNSSFDPDNIALDRHPIYSGAFLVSFMVDARGGAMRGCRHSGVRIIVPPGKACMPTRVTCKLVKREKLIHPPPLMEGEALASRLLEMGPTGAKFLGPVIIEVPHFASLREKEREIVILRSDNGETWREHQVEATEEAVHEALNGSFDGEELESAEELYNKRITRILTADFPQYFAVVTRIRQETKTIGPEAGMLSSTVVPQVQAVFPEGALTKKIKVGLQAQPIAADVVSKMLGNRVAVSPIVTVEPRRRKFHKPITLTIPLPKASGKGMMNRYSGADTPTLRLLCSITGGTTPAQWEDITGTTPLSFVNDCVSFTTTVSARFWLMDCQNINEAAKMATELYREAIAVPFMAKFVVFNKAQDAQESRLRLFCMTDDKMDKTLENQEHFIEIARSKDVEVLEGKAQYVEMAGNLCPITKSGDQLYINFHAFRENRLPFTVRIRDGHQEPVGRVAFMNQPKAARGEAPQTPICNLNVKLPNLGSVESPIETEETQQAKSELDRKYNEIRAGYQEEQISKAELRLTDIADTLQTDWEPLAVQLGLDEEEITKIKTEYTYVSEQALVMLHLWVQKKGPEASGNALERALRQIDREDVINNCMYNVEAVLDDEEKAVAKDQLEASYDGGEEDDQAGFDEFKAELGPSRDASMVRGLSLDVSYDEHDLMKESESAEGSETGSTGKTQELSMVSETPVASSQHKPEQEDVEELISRVEGITVMGMDDRRSLSSEEDYDERIKEQDVSEDRIVGSAAPVQHMLPGEDETDQSIPSTEQDTESAVEDMVVQSRGVYDMYSEPPSVNADNGQALKMEDIELQYRAASLISSDGTMEYESAQEEFDQLMSADEGELDESAAGGEIQTTRIIMRKQVHKKTVIRDGREETIVTEDTNIEQDNEGPEELQDSMQRVIDQFMEQEADQTTQQNAPMTE